MLSNHQDRSETLTRLLAAVAREEELDADQEAELAAAAKRGDATAARRLATSNLGRVVGLARAFRNKGVPIEDLVNEGTLGLLQATVTFDPTRGARFFTYAAFFVRRAMVGALARGAKVIRVPRQVRSRVRGLAQRLDERASVVGREQALAEESLRLGVPPGEIGSLLARSSPFEVSLDDVSAPGSVARAASLPSAEPPPDAEMMRRERTVEVTRALGTLPERERSVLSRRFGLDGSEPQTLRAVGSQLQLSKERVRQIEERAKHAIRRRLELRLGGHGAFI